MKGPIALIGLLGLASAFMLGAAYGQTLVRTALPEIGYVQTTIYVEQPSIEVVREILVEKPIVQTKTEYVDRIVEKEVPLALCSFGTAQDLRSWLAEDDTNEVMKIARAIDPSLDCRDAVEMLIEHARKEGRDIMLEALPAGFKLDTNVMIPEAHSMGIALVRDEDTYYLIEAWTDEIFPRFK